MLWRKLSRMALPNGFGHMMIVFTIDIMSICYYVTLAENKKMHAVRYLEFPDRLIDH